MRSKEVSYLDGLGFGDDDNITYEKDLSALDHRWGYDEIAKERQREMKEAMDIARGREPFAYPEIGVDPPGKSDSTGRGGENGGFPTAEHYRMLVRKAAKSEGVAAPPQTVVNDSAPLLLDELGTGEGDDILEIDFYSSLMDDEEGNGQRKPSPGKKRWKGQANSASFSSQRSPIDSVSPQRRGHRATKGVRFLFQRFLD